MNRCFCVRALFTLAILVEPLFAQEALKADAAKLLTPEASLNLRTISDLQFSPDGTRLAFVVTEPSKAKRGPRHIWLNARHSGSIRQFTYSAKTKFSRPCSPDANHSAFLSIRSKE